MPKRRSRRGSTLTPLGVWVAWAGVLAMAGLVGWIWWSSGRPLSWRRSAAPTAEAKPASTGRVGAARSVPQRSPGQGAEFASNRGKVMPGISPTAGSNLVTSVTTGAPPGGGLAFPSVPPATGAVTQASHRVSLSATNSRDHLVAVQAALARRGISSGPIDGVLGSQTRTALRVFQRQEGLPPSGLPDAATLKALRWEEEGFEIYRVTPEDLGRLTPVPKTWLGKASSERLDYETLLELVAERAQAHPRLIRQLNPDIDWHRVGTGAVVRVPGVVVAAPKGRAARVRISLGEKTLRVYDDAGALLAHFPCSIARRVEKRPVGELRVVKVAPNPNYRFDPEIFRESEEARRIGRKLMIPPGPNNPVGTAWIGLDRPGYGIHGTPHPEDVGRTESHGCFRLANWNAERLLKLAWVGMPVQVEP